MLRCRMLYRDVVCTVCWPTSRLLGCSVARLLDRCTIAKRHGRIVTSLHSRRTQGGHPVGRGCSASACIGTGAAVAIAVTVAAVEVAP